MATQSEAQEKERARDDVLWCNFCGHKSTDQAEYLKHSCKDILDAKGVSTAPTETKECR
ncbi:MAG: hypothetical protein P4L33_01900 [Capsulimonadaceae bacterium]|nr:hypothetical protein [Capsulimonadaceae bacterium]